MFCVEKSAALNKVKSGGIGGRMRTSQRDLGYLKQRMGIDTNLVCVSKQLKTYVPHSVTEDQWSFYVRTLDRPWNLHG